MKAATLSKPTAAVDLILPVTPVKVRPRAEPSFDRSLEQASRRQPAERAPAPEAPTASADAPEPSEVNDGAPPQARESPQDARAQGQDPAGASADKASDESSDPTADGVTDEEDDVKSDAANNAPPTLAADEPLVNLFATVIDLPEQALPTLTPSPKPTAAAKSPTATASAATDPTLAVETLDEASNLLQRVDPTSASVGEGLTESSESDSPAAQKASAKLSRVTDLTPGSPVSQNESGPRDVGPQGNTRSETSTAAPPQVAQTAGSSPPEDADSGNVSRVARGLVAALQQRGGSVTLRLTPPEMGTVRIDMQVVEQAVRVTLSAPTENVRQLLQHRLATLRQSLESHGLQVEQLSVQTATSSGASNQSRFDQAPQQQQQDSSAQQHDAQGRSRGFLAQDQRRDGQSPRGQHTPEPAEDFADRLTDIRRRA